MPKKSGKCRGSGCPFVFAGDIFGDRWSLLVIRDMLFFGKRRFSDLAASDEQIATNILTDRLKKLEAAGLIRRRRDPGNRRQVIYRLTDKGKDLLPAMLEIVRWSAKHDPETGVPAEFLHRLDTDPKGMTQEIRDQA